MGKYQSKEQVIVSQNDNDMKKIEEKFQYFNIISIVITTLLFCIVFYFIYRRSNNRVKKWIQRQIQKEQQNV